MGNIAVQPRATEGASSGDVVDDIIREHTRDRARLHAVLGILTPLAVLAAIWGIAFAIGH